jgi:hypothetical protein
VGTWTGRRAVQTLPDAAEDVVNSLAKVEIQIKPTGRFALYWAPYSMEGTLQRTTTGASLPIDSVMGRGIERQPPDVQKAIPRLELIPSGDGTLSLKDASNPSETITLKREAKPAG